MKCPFCQHDETQVIDSRESDEGTVIRRRRRCVECDKRFTTYERVELSFPAVVKKNGSRTEFEPAKLRGSLMLALRKRPVSTEQIDTAVSRIEEKLLASAEREVASERIGELVMRELKKIDKVAYIRFASVYRSFEDLDEFADAIQEVSKPKKR
ncbi:MAG: transcriptional repressor NrdR [Burkholderiaceae bacterium]|nr:MAG: transcriptional repressor NrdR [Burkholderiaceae bacterium]